MRACRWLPCAWPGLAELWLQGSWSALGLAVGFAALLNLMLATTLVWTAWWSEELRFAGWTAVATMWLLCGWDSLRKMRLDGTVVSGDLFSRALNEYLQGNYFAAESLLRQILHKDGRDIDARLMLATLLRRMRRVDEARATLDDLKRYRFAEKWQLEIERELAQLKELEKSILLDAAQPDHDQPLTKSEPLTEPTRTNISRAA